MKPDDTEVYCAVFAPRMADDLKRTPTAEEIASWDDDDDEDADECE